MFIPDGMFGFGAAGRWAVRTNGDPIRLMPDVRRVVAEVDPLVPIGDLKPMTDYVDRAMAPTRFSLVLIAIFGARRRDSRRDRPVRRAVDRRAPAHGGDRRAHGVRRAEREHLPADRR